MGSDAERTEQDYASYRLLVDLWARENPIKTTKLLVLLATNALLIAGMSIARRARAEELADLPCRGRLLPRLGPLPGEDLPLPGRMAAEAPRDCRPVPGGPQVLCS